MRRWVFAGLVLTLAIGGVALAQVTRPAVGRPAASNPAVTAAAPNTPNDLSVNLPPDPARLQSDIRALDRRVGALETSLTALRGEVGALRADVSRASFTCPADTVSRNGAGVTEDCSPYACNALDGRCRTTAVRSDQCATGFAWCAINNHCTTAAECSSGSS